MNNQAKIKDISANVKVVKPVYPQVYSYTLPDFPEENGWQKIGYTERFDVDERIKEQTRTAAKTLRYDKLWNQPAKFFYKEGWFTDKEFHRFLQQKGVPRSTDAGNSHIDGTEKFYFNGTPEKSVQLFDDFVNGRGADSSGKKHYTLRPEQKDAVDMTVAYSVENQTTDFENPNPKANFLWNAKPRFGKTLTAYDFAKNFVNSTTGEKGAKSVLIMTNRPAIADSWYKDYAKFIDGYHFISTVKSVKNEAKTYQEFLDICDDNKRKIVFLSLQDFKGGKHFGGKFDKLEWVSEEEWDLLIIDEAHEATDTDKMINAAAKLKKRFSLHLSGTPFRQIADGRYSKEQIYNWTYLDEQQAKEDELARGEESGAHTDMPDLKFFAYEMSQAMLDAVNRGVEIDGDKVAFAYDGLNSFFAARNGKFIHESDVRRFLDLLTENTKYPFSTPELREELKHTFWWVGNRVESVRAMKNLLATHPVFKDYEVIAAVGKGSSKGDDYEEESSNDHDNRESLAKVRDAIKNHSKTITLSVGQLTTGVTVKEWSAVLMMSDTKSDTQYTQAIFRAQNPYSYVEGGKYFQKKSAYVFDFALIRILETYDKLANSLVSDRALGELTDKDRQENNRELLNYMPVIAQDENGEMVQLDASQVLTFPQAAKAKEIVSRQFISNHLFADGLSVFRLPTAIRAIINKMAETKDDGKKVRANDVDDSSTTNQKNSQRKERETRNTRAIFGDKLYGNEIDKIVSGALNFGVNQNVVPTIVSDYMESVIAEPIAKWSETYNVPKSEVKAKVEETEKKVYEIVDGYISPDMTNKNKNDLVSELSDFILEELPKDTVGSSEDALNKKEDDDETSILISKLKTFSRAIPILVMASENPEELNIHNIEKAVDEQTFIEIFTERHGDGQTLHQPFTIEDFKRLRDGGTYEEKDGTVINFEGCFNTYAVNASIKEFIEKRKKIANYLNPSIKEDIFAYIAPQKSNQIFTPRRVINQMLNILEEENPGIFSNPNTTFCDLYIKSGMYLTEIAKRLDRGLADQIPDQKARIKHIFENQLYGFTPSKVIDAVARSFIYGVADYVSDKNLTQKDLTPDFKEGKTLNMKFDVVIGNPPYQEETKDTSDKPIYNYFMDNAYKVANRVCFITPARFLFNAGKTPKKWNEKMLSDKHLKVAFYEQKSSEVFANTDIKGGVAITYRDTNKDFGKIGTFTHFEELNSALRKIINIEEGGKFLDSLYHSTDSYKFSQKMHDDFPDAKNRLSKGHEKTVASSVLKNLPEIFAKERCSEGDLRFIGVIANKRKWRYIAPEYIEEHPNLRKFKVMLPGSNGSGAIGEVLSTPLVGEPLVGEPLVGHTQTFISFGAFETREEAENLLKYIKTKFARTMLGTLKITQSNKKDTWRNVPLQNFTANSDIDWSQSIPEIDRQLYKKYGLSEQEIAFIEEKVRAME